MLNSALAVITVALGPSLIIHALMFLWGFFFAATVIKNENIATNEDLLDETSISSASDASSQFDAFECFSIFDPTPRHTFDKEAITVFGEVVDVEKDEDETPMVEPIRNETSHAEITSSPPLSKVHNDTAQSKHETPVKAPAALPTILVETVVDEEDEEEEEESQLPPAEADEKIASAEIPSAKPPSQKASQSTPPQCPSVVSIYVKWMDAHGEELWDFCFPPRNESADEGSIDDSEANNNNHDNSSDDASFSFEVMNSFDMYNIDGENEAWEMEFSGEVDEICDDASWCSQDMHQIDMFDLGDNVGEPFVTKNKAQSASDTPAVAVQQNAAQSAVSTDVLVSVDVKVLEHDKDLMDWEYPMEWDMLEEDAEAKCPMEWELVSQTNEGALVSMEVDELWKYTTTNQYDAASDPMDIDN